MEEQDKNTGEEQVKEATADQAEPGSLENEKVEENLSKQEIIDRFEALVKADDLGNQRKTIKEWKARFEELTLGEEAEQVKAFEQKENKEEGEQFEFQTNALDYRWKELFNIYQDKLSAHKKAVAEAEKENLKAKQDLLEELKELVEAEMKNVGAAFTSFYAIRDKWNEIGEVNKSKFKQLQYDYSHYRDLFYYNVSIHDELKNYDFKKNAAQKKEIISELKTLADQESIRKMEKSIKDLQAKWDEIGPTSNEDWEALKSDYWSLVNGMYDKIRDHYKAKREAQAQVLEEKNGLIARMQDLVDKAEAFSSPKEWIQSSKLVNELHQEWKKAGYAARSKEEEIWSTFKEMSDDLRKRQNVFFDELKEANQKVAEAKNKLIEKAKGLKDSKEWKNTSEALIKLQKEWKSLGHLPYKQDQKLWETFRQSCDDFFNAKKEYYDTLDDRQAENFAKKEAIAGKIAASKTEQELRALITEWQAVDYVPKAKIAEADTSFNKAVQAAAKNLKIAADSLGMLRFEAKLTALKDDDNAEVKMKAERQFIQTQIEKVQEELHRFEENMGFFGPSKGAQKLKEIVEKRMEEAEAKLQNWKDKLKMLR